MTPNESGRLEVGRVARAHGVRGDLLLTMTTDRLAERMAVGSRLYVGRTAPTAIVMELTAAQEHGQYWRVHFAGVSDRNAAEALRGSLVFGDPIDDPDAMFIHELMGAQVVDQNGVARGIVTGVLDNPAALILEVDNAHLVPMNFVDSFDAGIITVDVPVGIFPESSVDTEGAPEAVPSRSNRGAGADRDGDLVEGSGTMAGAEPREDADSSDRADRR